MVRDIFGAFDVDKDGFDVGEPLGAFVSCPDWVSARGMRMLGVPVKGDPVAMTGSVISPAAVRPNTNACSACASNRSVSAAAKRRYPSGNADAGNDAQTCIATPGSCVPVDGSYTP